uniref:Uncharacterized protein n=1 Tax=Thermogemmatispora argillosa TaxID=2045280 RepID=A0A455SXF4_9CHLR|nr:hypothetical protein KTA_03970 [Thermogemmatispora argillosa]
MKTVNLALHRNRGVTTHHHLTEEIIDKYQSVYAWYIGLYKDIELQSVWKVPPHLLEPLFLEWRKRIRQQGGRPLNNPKIPLRYVFQGTCVYRQVTDDRQPLFSGLEPPDGWT